MPLKKRFVSRALFRAMRPVRSPIASPEPSCITQLLSRVMTTEKTRMRDITMTEKKSRITCVQLEKS
jgi:hypothetical protein